MPNTKSARKTLRQSFRNRKVNLRRTREMRRLIKEVQVLGTSGKHNDAAALLPKAYKAIDKATKTGVIKQNTAGRKKSRIAKLTVAPPNKTA